MGRDWDRAARHAIELEGEIQRAQNHLSLLLIELDGERSPSLPLMAGYLEELERLAAQVRTHVDVQRIRESSQPPSSARRPSIAAEEHVVQTVGEDGVSYRMVAPATLRRPSSGPPKLPRK